MKGKKNYHRSVKNVLNELADAFSSIQSINISKKLNKHNVKVLGAANRF